MVEIEDGVRGGLKVTSRDMAGNEEERRGGPRPWWTYLNVNMIV